MWLEFIRKIRKYVFEIIILVFIIVCICLYYKNKINTDNSIFDYDLIIKLLTIFLPIIITVIIQISNKKIEENTIKTKGCPSIIFNSIQEFEKMYENGQLIQNKCIFKARFYDENGFLLKKGKITKITMYRSLKYEYEEYDSGIEIYKNRCKKYSNLEYTPKSENKLDKIENNIKEYYYLKIPIDINLEDITCFTGYFKFAIEISVLTIFGLEVKMICNLIFQKDDFTKQKLIKKDNYAQKEISHRYIDFKIIDYIG